MVVHLFHKRRLIEAQRAQASIQVHDMNIYSETGKDSNTQVRLRVKTIRGGGTQCLGVGLSTPAPDGWKIMGGGGGVEDVR